MKPPRNSASSDVRYCQVDADHDGQRLDNFLISNLKGVPRSHIYRILRTGEVRINRGRRAAGYRLRAGDRVRIPPLRLPAKAPDRARLATGSDSVEAFILYEDDGLIVVDKPAGLAVHGGSGVNFGVIEALRAARPRARALELVHRLDRDTSGCLLVAKRRPVLLALHAQLREGTMDKRYIALVQGPWREKAKRVQAPLAKYRLRSGERMVEVSEAGKEAVTRLSPRRRFANATLVEIKLLTGRTHQARVHAAHIGHPIAGDQKYGDREFNREMRRLGLKRLFLHAGSLGFLHPSTGVKLVLKAPLPDGLSSFLECLQDEAPL